MANVDSLDIQISASAKKANDAIDILIDKLGKLSDALDFNTNIMGINKQEQAFDSLGETIKSVSGVMETMKKSMSGISDFVTPQTQKLANTVARIAKTGESGEKAAKSLPKIGNALSKVTADMARAKNIDSSINRFTSSIARLASAGDKSTIVAKELPKVGNALKDAADKMLRVEGISDSTNSFTQAIAQLASAGDKAEKTAAGLDQLADGTIRFFNTMKNAPQISENTIRMAQAMAQLSAAGGRASASIKSTNTTFQTVSKSLQSLSNVAKKASDIIKKALSGIGKIVSGAFSKIGQIGLKASNTMKRVAGDMVAAFSRITHSSKGLNTASSNLGRLLKTIIGFKGLQGLFNFGKQAIKLGSDITEVENVVNTAFGSMAQHAYDFASTAKEQFGLSELAAKQYSGTMMAMLKSSGVAQAEAAKMSTTLAGLAGDIASFYNLETDEAFYKLRAAISGETEPMKALGVNMNIVNLEAFAMSRGINKAYREMTLAEQATLRYNYILDKTKDAQGDFAKTIGTFANQWRLLKLNIQSISAVIGQGLIAAILPGIKWLNALMSKLMEVAKTFKSFMYTITGFKPDTSGGGIVDDMAGIGDAADGLGELGEEAEDAGKKIKKNLLLLPFDELNVLSEASSDISEDLEDIGNIDTGLGDIGGFENFDDTPINEWAKKLRDAFLAQDWEGLGRIIAELINKGLEWLYQKIKQITPKVEKALKNLAKVINSFIKNLDWDLLGKTIGAGINLLVKAFNALFGDEGINLELLGQKLSVGLRGMIEEVNWRELGNAIGNYLMISWRIAYGFIEDMWRINPNTLLTGWAEAGIAIGETLVGIFERIDFEKISAVLTEGFKGALETITYALNTFSDNLDWIVEKINLGLDRLYDGLKWDSTAGENMGRKITAFTESISTAFNKLLDLDFGKAGKVIGAGITDIVRAFNQLTDIEVGIDFEKIGKKLSDGLRGLVTEIPWEEFGNALGNGFMLSWRILDGFLTDMAEKNSAGLTGWQELGNGIANAINGLFDKFDLSKIASIITRFVNGIFETLRQAVGNIRWDDIADNIANGLNELIEGINWEENGKTLSDFAMKLFGTFREVAEKTDWKGLGEGIGQFLSNIDWSGILGTVFSTIYSVYSGLVQTWPGKILKILGEMIASLNLASFFLTKLTPILTSIFGFPAGTIAGLIISGLVAISPILFEIGADIVMGLINGIKSLINGIIDVVKWIFDTIVGGIKWLFGIHSPSTVMAEIGTFIMQGLINGISSLIDFVAGIFNGLAELIKGIWIGLSEFLGVLWEGIKILAETIWGGIGEFFSGIWNGIQSVAQIAWTGISEFLQNTWNFISETASIIWNGISDFFGGIWNRIKEVAELVWNGISEFLIGSWNFIKDNAEIIMNAVSDFFKSVWEGIQSTAKEIWESISVFLKKTWEGIQKTAKDIWNSVSDFFKSVWNGIKDTAKNAWESISAFLQDAWNGIKNTAENIWNGVKDFFSETWDSIKSTSEEKWENIKNTLSGIWEGIKNTAKEVADGIGEFFSNAWDGIKTKTKETWDNVTETLGNFANNAYEKVKDVPEKVYRAVRDTGGKMKSAGENLIGGVVEGIKNTAGRAYDAISGVAGNLVSSFKNTLGIHSPSKVFLQLAQYTIQGFANGVDSGKENILKKMSEMARTVSKPFSGMEKILGEIGEGGADSFLEGMENFVNSMKNIGKSAAKVFSDTFNENAELNILIHGDYSAPEWDLETNAKNKMEMGKDIFYRKIGGESFSINNQYIFDGIEEAAYRGFVRANSDNTKEEKLLEELIQAVREGKNITIDGREIVNTYDKWKGRMGWGF